MEIILKSLASGVITGIIIYLSNHLNPTLAGAIGGIPIVFAISYILITTQDRSLSTQFLLGGIYGAIAAIFFSLFLIGLNKFALHHWLNFFIAYVACFLLALLMSKYFN
jgi:uncharacterized membrane protein (GlpM family)